MALPLVPQPQLDPVPPSDSSSSRTVGLGNRRVVGIDMALRMSVVVGVEDDYPVVGPVVVVRTQRHVL